MQWCIYFLGDLQSAGPRGWEVGEWVILCLRIKVNDAVSLEGH